jgi:hypothetical protein
MTAEKTSLQAAIAIAGASARRIKTAAKETAIIATMSNPFVLMLLSIDDTESMHRWKSSASAPPAGKDLDMNCIETAFLIKYILLHWRSRCRRESAEQHIIVVEPDSKSTKSADRVLGDEWLDWRAGADEQNITEGKKTFLLLSLAVLLFAILLAFLFLYLVIPRFEQFGPAGVVVITILVSAIVLFLLLWYAFLLFAVLSRKNYMFMCLERGFNLLTLLFPFTVKLAESFGISRDRLSHSFIKVSNTLVPPRIYGGAILALLPRCLNRDLKSEVKQICESYPNVILQTAPGGNVARKIIREIKPRAIVAVACERDLVSGIQDVAPKIPVLGICNSRPAGPCKDTEVDLEEFRKALDIFCDRA